MPETLQPDQEAQPKAQPAPRFQPGEIVRIRTGSPPSHFRTPEYVQGKIGVIEAIHGLFTATQKLWRMVEMAYPSSFCISSASSRHKCGRITIRHQTTPC